MHCLGREGQANTQSQGAALLSYRRRSACCCCWLIGGSLPEDALDNAYGMH